MKKSNLFVRVIMSFIVLLGVFGARLAYSNDVTMNYTEAEEAAANLLGIEAVPSDDPIKDINDIRKLMRGNRISLKNAVLRLAKTRDAMQHRLRVANVTPVLTPTQKYLIGKKSDLSSETDKLIKNGGLVFSDGFIYYNKEYTTVSGNVEIIQSNDTIGVGYSNLNDNGIVPEHLNLAVDYIEFGTNAYDSASANVLETAWTPAYDNVYLKNAELEIIVNGKVQLSIPVQMMKEVRHLRGAAVGAVYDEMGMGYNLEKPIIVPGGSKIQFNLKMPTGGTGITNTTTLRDGLHILMAGSGTKSR